MDHGDSCTCTVCHFARLIAQLAEAWRQEISNRKSRKEAERMTRQRIDAFDDDILDARKQLSRPELTAARNDAHNAALDKAARLLPEREARMVLRLKLDFAGFGA